MAWVVTASKNHLPKIFYLCKSYISCYIYIDDKAQTLNKNRGSPAEEPIRRTDWTKAGWQNNHRAQHRESGKNSLDWRRDFIKTYPERDIPQSGPRIPAETLERFWTMLAHNQGTPLNASHLARNLDVSGVTIGRYLDLMTPLCAVFRERSFSVRRGDYRDFTG